MALNDITFVEGQGGLGRPLPGADFISGMVFYGSAPTSFSTNNIQKVFSLAQAEALGIDDSAGDETSAVFSTTLTQGATGDTITFTATLPASTFNGATTPITIGTYAQASGDTTAAALATSVAAFINSGTATHGFTATTSSATVKISWPKGYGLTVNAPSQMTVAKTGTLTFTTPTVTAATPSIYIHWHYQIAEYFRLQPQGVLYVGVFATPGSYAYTELQTLQNFANGIIRQAAIYKDTTTTAATLAGDTTTIQGICTTLDQAHKPLSVLFSANVTGQALSSLTDLSGLQNKKVSVVISQDGANEGALLYQQLGKSIPTLGAALGAVSLAAVSQSIAWVQKHRYINWGTYIGDEGDNLVQGNWFENITSVDTGVYVTGVAGFRFFDNKMHIPVGQATGNYLSVALFVKATTSTSDINISRNCIEAYSGSGIVVTTDSVHTISKVEIQNNITPNNTGGNMHNIAVYTPMANHINNVSVTNNTISRQGSWSAIYLNNVNGYILQGNALGVPIAPSLEDSEVNCLSRMYPTITGDAVGNTLGDTVKSISPLGGISTIKIIPNPLTYSRSNVVTGSLIIHTKIPRTANKQFLIHVRGMNNTNATNTDFTVYGYANGSQNGSIDEQPGGIARQSIEDNGVDGWNKYIGVDSLGYIAIAIGDTNTSIGTSAYQVEYVPLYGGDASSYTSGWFTTISANTNFNWSDIHIFGNSQNIKGPITLNGDATGTIGSNIVASNTPINGASTQQYFPNILAYQFASTQTGALIIHTKIPRTANHTQLIHVHGTSFLQNIIDFTVGCDMLSSQNGTIDGQPGSVYKQSITDNGTDGLNKYIGVDSLGFLAIAIGDIGTSQNTIALTIDYTNLIGGASTYSSGWFVTNSTVANFNWSDIHIFGNSQPIKGPISSITNTITKFTSINTIGNSSITDNGITAIATGNFTINGIATIHTYQSTNSTDSILGKNSGGTTVSIPASRFASGFDLNFNAVKSAGQDAFIFKGNDTGKYQNIREIGNVIYDTSNHRWLSSYSSFTLPVPPEATDTVEHTHIIASQDLVHWYGLGFVPWPSEDGYMIYLNGYYHIYFEDKRAVPFRNIRLFTTTDTSFNTWTDIGTVFDIDSTNLNCWECKDVSSPTVFIDKDTVKMLYEGRGTNNGGAIGIAWSLDGNHFTRYSNSPVISGNNILPKTFTWSTEVIPDEIIKRPEGYYLSSHNFTTVNSITNSQDFRTGISFSTDLHNWRDYLGAPMQIVDGNIAAGEGLMLYYNGNALYGMYVDSAYKSLYGGKLITVPQNTYNTPVYKSISMDVNHTYNEVSYQGDMNTLNIAGSINGYANSFAINKPASGTNGHFISLALDTTHTAQIYFPNIGSTSPINRPFYRHMQTTWDAAWQQIATSVDTASNSTTNIKLATQYYVSTHSGLGTCTSIIPGWGFTSNTPIITSGSMVMDTSKVCSVTGIADTAAILRTALLDSAMALRALTLNTIMDNDNTTTLEYRGTSQNLSGNDTASTFVSTSLNTANAVIYTDGNGAFHNTNGASSMQVLRGTSGSLQFQQEYGANIYSTSHIATSSDNFIVMNGGTTLTLPPSGIPSGWPFFIKADASTSSANPVIITTTTTIDPAGHTITLTNPYQSIGVFFDGAKYEKICDYYSNDSVKNRITYTGTATLSSGTVTVSDVHIKTGTPITVSYNTLSGTQGFLSTPSASITDGTSFVINSSNSADNSTVNYSYTISY